MAETARQKKDEKIPIIIFHINLFDHVLPDSTFCSGRYGFLQFYLQYFNSIQLSEMKLPSFIQTNLNLSLQLINSDSSYTFSFLCNKYNSTAIENGLDLDKAIAETRINIPILIRVKQKGDVIFEGDTINGKTSFINKFKTIAKNRQLNDITHGLSGYLSLIESMSFPEIIRMGFPEIEILGKGIQQTFTNKEYEINDKEVFNDFLFDYQDTIKISRKTELKIINSIDIIERNYSKVVSETELKSYILDKYPKAWAKMKIDSTTLEPFRKKLDNFKPVYQEIIKTVLSNKNKVIKMVDYKNDEEIMLMGGTLIHCVISKE